MQPEEPTQSYHGLPDTTVADEIANTLTHGIGLILSIAAMSVMIYEAATHGDVWHVASCAVFGATLVMVYLSSTLYHAVWNKRVKKWLRVADHAAIYFLIAGTYTPFTLVTLRDNLGLALFTAVWAVGLVGVIQKLRIKNRHEDAGIVLYLVMGWMAVFGIKPLLELLDPVGVALLVGGGIVYSLGVLFYRLDRKFAHAVWHLFVMGGSTCHVIAVLYYVIPS